MASALDIVDFEKGNGLVPAIAQDVNTGKVLMMAYMNREALETTLREGRACYWSRSRRETVAQGGHFRRHPNHKRSACRL